MASNFIVSAGRKQRNRHATLREILPNYRRFQAGPDPFDRMWEVEFRWLQTGISIRHADTVDVKFAVWTTDEGPMERVVAMRHPELLDLSKKTGTPLSDAWCLKLAALHLKRMIETAEDMDKTLVTISAQDLETYAGELEKAAAGR